jgi:hypothetical protein
MSSGTAKKHLAKKGKVRTNGATARALARSAGIVKKASVRKGPSAAAKRRAAQLRVLKWLGDVGVLTPDREREIEAELSGE